MNNDISKEVLEDLYVKGKLPMSAVAKVLNCNIGRVAYQLAKQGIPVRTTSESVKLFVKEDKITIPKDELIGLYAGKKMPPIEIAKIFGCSVITVFNRLKRLGITRKSAGKRVKITKEELRELYVNQKLTTYEIAEIFNCCQATIWKRLAEFSITARTRNERHQNVPSKDELFDLYVTQKLSTWEIQKRFGYSRSTIHRKLNEYRIPARNLAVSHFLHPRKDFGGDLQEKAYLIGFRLGDLRVRKVYKNSETINVECGSTIPEQLELIKNLFENYGSVWITGKNRQGANNIGVSLSLSFDFLLPKKAPDWVFEKEDLFFSFFAGFTDAEGSIGVGKNKQAIYQLGNYDLPLLERLKSALAKFGIDTPRLYLGAEKGFVNPHNGFAQNGDYWNLRVSKKSELLKLLDSLKPYIKHPAKVPALQKAIENIEERNLLYGNINMPI